MNPQAGTSCHSLGWQEWDRSPGKQRSKAQLQDCPFTSLCPSESSTLSSLLKQSTTLLSLPTFSTHTLSSSSKQVFPEFLAHFTPFHTTFK